MISVRDDVLQAYMNSSNGAHITGYTTAKLPKFKSGTFSLLDRLLRRHINKADTVTVVKYLACWCYTDMTYKLLDGVMYIEAFNYRVAV